MITAKIDDVLRGDLKRNQTIRLRLKSNPNDLFGVSSEEKLRGSRQILAFHQYASLKGQGDLSTFSEYVPIKNSQTFEKDVVRLRKNLKRTPYPFRSCLVVTIEKLRSKHDSEKSNWHSKEFVLRIASVAVADQRFSAEGIKGAELENTYKDKSIEHFVFKPRDKINLEVQWLDSFEHLPKLPETIIKGQKYILQWNPCRNPNSQVANSFLDSSIDLSLYQPRKIELIKSLADQNPKKITSLRRQLQSHITERWTVRRIREYLSRPELRECPPFRNVEQSDGPVLGGQLYSETKDLGTVIWYTWLRNMQPEGEFQVAVTNKDGHIWTLELGYLGLQHYTDEQFTQDVLAHTLQRSFQAFWMIRNYNLARDPKSVLPVDFPGPSLERPQLLRDSNNRIKSVCFELTNGKALTADVDAHLQLTNILVDGKVCQAWTEAYDRRVENMNEIWKRIGPKGTEGKIRKFGSNLESVVSQGVLHRTELFMTSDFPGHNVLKPHIMGLLAQDGTICPLDSGSLLRR